MVKPELQRAGVSIVSQVEGALRHISVDVLQIEQVLIDLVRNAYEAIEDAGASSGMITVSARRSTERDVEIVASDTGPGFDAEQIASRRSTQRY